MKFYTAKNSEGTRRVAVPFLLVSILIVGYLANQCPCEAKEFDWNDLGVSIANSKSQNSQGPSNNLRVLVSPQRRQSKNYEYDPGNSSQPNSGEGSYTNSYGSYQSAANSPHSSSGSSISLTGPSSHSSAYSALSASLATLKSRLSARGVSLTGSLDEPTYQSSGSSSDTQTRNDHQANQSPNFSQTSYLSMTNGQDKGYSGDQGADNKTIVLAIPAKINFLTDSRSNHGTKQQSTMVQQPVQEQQVTVIQAPSLQQVRPEYVSSKPIEMIASQDGADSNASPDSDHQHQQYVIVNQSTGGLEHQTMHLVAQTSGGSTYPSVYQPIAGSGYQTVKYLSPYQQQGQMVAKVYQPSTSEGHSVDDVYGRCLDTCNSHDPRWRKHSISKYKYCCSRSSQYDSQLEHPNPDKLGESSHQAADDAYYSYLHRRTRARRSRRPRNRHANKSTSGSQESSSSSYSGDDSNASQEQEADRQTVRGQHESPYMRYYRSRQAHSDQGQDGSTDGYSKSSSKLQSRRNRNRDYDSTEPNTSSGYESSGSNDEEGAYPEPRGNQASSYGVGADYSADQPASLAGEEEDTRTQYGHGSSSDDSSEQEIGKTNQRDQSPEYLVDEQQGEAKPIDESSDPDATLGYRQVSSSRRRKSRRTGRKMGYKDHRYRKGRKNKLNKLQEQSLNHMNSSDPESATVSDQYRNSDANGSEDEQSRQMGSMKENQGIDYTDASDSAITSKLRSMNLNETTVINLSKTTMHLKEILMMLEKRAHLKANESSNGSQQTATQQTTPTPVPVTTMTNGLYPYSLLSSGQASGSSSALPSVLPSDYLTTEFSLKSPYRYESPSSLSSSPSLSVLPPYGSLNIDAYSSLPGFGSSQYGLSSNKHLSYAPQVHHPRKRRANKNMRYNQMMLQKGNQYMSSSSLPYQSALSKSQLMNPSYYQALHYPSTYSYTRTSYPASSFASYPYRNIAKTPYGSSLGHGPVSSKLVAAASSALYSDESRLRSLANLDQLASASSLRSARLRQKPFVFQSHLLPLYARHSILSQQPEIVKK